MEAGVVTLKRKERYARSLMKYVHDSAVALEWVLPEAD
jgi:hypothetical protein